MSSMSSIPIPGSLLDLEQRIDKLNERVLSLEAAIRRLIDDGLLNLNLHK